jgi:protein O-GlcNAc transferase
MALVTIAIPVYNEEEFLGETIQSALPQKTDQIEIFICDNGSTDNSFAIAKNYEASYDCVTVIRHSTNIGAAENFRYCLMLAKTKYFVWLGAHDLFSDDYIATAVDYLESHQEAVMVYPDAAVFVDRNNEVVRTGACSKIALRDNASRIERIMFVVKNLGYCTNIHGVFVTEVARKFPFEKIAGPDNLQLAIAAFYGEIHAINIQGIRRRELRLEAYEDKERRWIEQKIFDKTWYHPRFQLIWKHFEFVLGSREISMIDKVRFVLRSPFIFRWWRQLKSTFRRVWTGRV